MCPKRQSPTATPDPGNLFTFICAWRFLSEEHINMTKAAGVALGFLGVLLIARPWSSSGAINIFGVTYMIVGSMSVGCSFVLRSKIHQPAEAPCSRFADRARHDLTLFTFLATLPWHSFCRALPFCSTAAAGRYSP